MCALHRMQPSLLHSSWGTHDPHIIPPSFCAERGKEERPLPFKIPALHSFRHTVFNIWVLLPCPSLAIFTVKDICEIEYLVSFFWGPPSVGSWLNFNQSDQFTSSDCLLARVVFLFQTCIWSEYVATSTEHLAGYHVQNTLSLVLRVLSWE